MGAQGEPQREPRPELDEDTIAFAGKLFHWARSGGTAELTELLEMGLPPNLRNDKGDSLLMLASYHGHAELARALMRHGADPELANDRGQTPLAAAAFKGDGAVLRVLLEEGAAVDGCGPDGRTALMTAAMFDRVGMVEFLLASGADPDARDARGLTAREAALAMGAANAAARLGNGGEAA